MSSPAAPPDDGTPASQSIFPDEILGDIFLRLDSAADLTRASAACTAFLRVARFLRRNRSLYRRPVVGFIPIEPPPPPPQPPHPPIHQLIEAQRHPRALHHAEPPHPSASAGRALAQLVDLTFSFVPDPTSWRICDAGDGRILLASRVVDTTADFADLVVCDPLHRRYVRIPPIPDDLTTGISRCGRAPSLAPAGEEESSFGVLWIVTLDGKVSAFVFSSTTGKWSVVTFDGWRGNGGFMLTSCRYYAHESLYHSPLGVTDVLMLDTRRMEFSVISIPCVSRTFQRQAIVDTADGRFGSLTIGNGMLYLWAEQDNDAGAEKWKKKTIPLPDADSLSYTFSGTGGGYLLLQAIPRYRFEVASSSQGVPKVQYFIHSKEKVQYFTLEVKTLLLEKLCVSDKRIDFAYLYANFPLLSLPTV